MIVLPDYAFEVGTIGYTQTEDACILLQDDFMGCCRREFHFYLNKGKINTEGGKFGCRVKRAIALFFEQRTGPGNKSQHV